MLSRSSTRCVKHIHRSYARRVCLQPGNNTAALRAPSHRSLTQSASRGSVSISQDLVKQYKESYGSTSNDSSFWDTQTSTGDGIYKEGERVTLNGYLGRRRDISASLSFADLYRDSTGDSIQIVSRAADSKELHEAFKGLKPHSAIAVTGTIARKRGPSKSKSDGGMSTNVAKDSVLARLELHIEKVHCLAAFPEDIIVSDEAQFGANKRHLQLRFDPQLARRITFRSKLTSAVQSLLQDFVHVETPVLFKSTPEGAREFLVPTRRPGFAYALPQSPQQYKQVLMASGIGRYYQIARCFRDEDLRADRQPEFTQLDMEIPFADGEHVMDRVEKLVHGVYAHFGGLAELGPEAQTLPRMTYEEAMSKHGVDKPDLRIKDLITRVDHILPSNLVGMMTSIQEPIIEAVKFSLSDSPGTTRSLVKVFMDSADALPFQQNPDGPPGVFIYDSTKPLGGLQAFGFEGQEALEAHFADSTPLQQGDLIVLQARSNVPHAGGSTSLGRLRTALHRAAVAAGHIALDPKHHYLWVTEFPLFTPSAADPTSPGQGGTTGLNSTHHPFTAPYSAADVDLLFTDPALVKADHYDLVVNGVELGGGSRRIHSVEVQKYVMREVLGMREERLRDFDHLFEALRSGCPPHAGIALGLDRWVAVLTGTESVRDVIAFPKNGKGVDEMVGSPTLMTKEQQAIYHLEVLD